MTRQSICTCGALAPSAPSLGFFSSRPDREYDYYFCGHNDSADWDGTPSDNSERDSTD